MQLINTDGMVFIGPGSEWFWTTVGSIVTAVSLIAIFRQLRMQRSADAMKQIDAFMQDFFSERLLRHQLTVLFAIRDGVSRDNLPLAATTAIANYLEKIGTLAHEGHLDLKLLGGATGICQGWWATMEPTLLRLRVETGLTIMFGGFEWLVGKYAEADRRAGVEVRYDDAWQSNSLARRISLAEEWLRVESELRTVIVVPSGAAPGQGRRRQQSE